ncbi:hypothetical protein OOU_Y34scaffold01189g6 [Pyricularia oryzae Y34]|uniref:NB-ARC domain-containing protein n=1 Tax=Pyricularia oryzae (strain Y34) TaxID=1143189 RepID=A0AA97NLH9_PYRO3|nr:hypothetical protein OOU_Y34scaffold01189g6 [Pyricularia oryzae Y34]
MVNIEKTADMAAAEPQADSSPIWKTALERYFAETRKGGIKDAAIENHLWTVQTPEDLLNGIEAIVPPNTEPSISWARALKELKPVLLGLSDFAAIIAWAFGMDGKTEIDSKKNAQPVLAELVEMLGELQRTLPRIQKYEKELPMTDALEKALLDMYSEIIVFCAYAVTTFRNNPNIGRSPAWLSFNQRFAQTKTNLEKFSRRIDEVVDMIRLSRESRTAETVAIIQNTKSKDPSVRLPCHSIPHGLNLRFFGRESQMGILKETLGPEKNRQEMRAISIHGIGGVGKTQLALQYANTSLGIYDLIAWVPAESQIKLVQALSAFTTKLGLAEEHDQMDNSQVVQRLKDWLNTCGKNFLLVFDNVDDVDILEQIWPASSHASVIITTRSPSVASRRSKKILRLECFALEPATEMIYALSGKRPSQECDVTAAVELCELLGGLPLAMEQVAAFIRDRDFLFSEVLPKLKKSAEKVFARTRAIDAYEHTVSTVWNLSLEQLSEQAKILHNVLAFFDPDHVSEHLINQTKVRLNDPAWEFLLDDFDQLMKLTKDHGLRPENPGIWAELVFRAGTYLWEKEQPYLAQAFIEFGIHIHNDDSSSTMAQAHRILGHILLDIAQPHAALKAYTKALSIRLRTEEANSPQIADVYDSIACSYTEIGDMPNAFDFIERATAIHLAHDPQHMARTDAIRAMACLRDCRPSEALQALQKCWKLQSLSQQEIEQSRYPKHSGDVMLLARILWALEERSTGRELASRAVSIRRGIFGENGGPRVADSLFHLALMLSEDGEHVLSAKLLREITQMDVGMKEIKPHQARAFWFLAKEEGKIGTRQDLCEDLKRQAKTAYQALKHGQTFDDSDQAYMNLVSWMLW